MKNEKITPKTKMHFKTTKNCHEKAKIYKKLRFTKNAKFSLKIFKKPDIYFPFSKNTFITSNTLSLTYHPHFCSTLTDSNSGFSFESGTEFIIGRYAGSSDFIFIRGFRATKNPPS